MEEILGGALLIFGVNEDYDAGLIDLDEVFRRIGLINKYEDGELTLQGLNCIW